MIVDLITKITAEWLLDIGMIYDPGGMEQESMKFHHAIQNNLQFKT